MNYSVSVEDINKCLNIIYQLDIKPTNVRTLSTGVLFNLQPVNYEEYHFQVICCTDGTLDLQVVFKERTGLLISGDTSSIKVYLNDWIKGNQNYHVDTAVLR